jgi:hypothetical protein
MTLKNEQIEMLYKGSIDMHIHVAPDPEWDRRADTAETAIFAERGGMRAFVAKSFFYPTTTEARIAMRVAENVNVFGSVTIGYGTTGGLDYAAQTIENHAKIGCKVVWFPAFDAFYCRKGIGKEGGIYILDDYGKLKSEAMNILDVVKQYNMVLCKGHISYPETESLFTQAKSMGIEKMVLTHPLADTWGVFTMEQIRYLVAMGAYAEITLCQLMPRMGAMDPADYVDFVKAIGAERVIMSTDFAQCMDPTPAEGLRYFIGTMLQFGCTGEEVEKMVKKNPARLLELD